MQITRQADYAIRAIVYLSQLGEGEKAPTRKIAQEQKIPSSFLAKIISQLSIAGLIHTSRGASGGVSLARASAEISVLDVVEAIDGPVILNACTEPDFDCPIRDSCPIMRVWQEARTDLSEKLASATFAPHVQVPFH